jgi:hypothetical protein
MSNTSPLGETLKSSGTASELGNVDSALTATKVVPSSEQWAEDRRFCLGRPRMGFTSEKRSVFCRQGVVETAGAFGTVGTACDVLCAPVAVVIRMRRLQDARQKVLERPIITLCLAIPMGDPLLGRRMGWGIARLFLRCLEQGHALRLTTGFFAREYSIPLVSSAVHAAANTGVSPLPLVGRNDRFGR